MKHKNIDFDNDYALIEGKGSKVRKICLGGNISKGIKSYLLKRKKG